MPNHKVVFLFFFLSPVPISCFGELLGNGYGQEEKLKLPHFVLS